MNLITKIILWPKPMFFLANLISARKYVVVGDSMEWSLSRNRRILVSKLFYRFNKPSRGNIVLVRDPEEPTRELIKRVVGLPGETIDIKSGEVFIDGCSLDEPYILQLDYGLNVPAKSWLLTEDEYLVLGDNRDQSRDSRTFGPVSCELIVGKAWLCCWPPKSWGILIH